MAPAPPFTTRIVELLVDRGYPMRPVEIGEALSIPTHTAATTCNNLAKRGLIEQVKNQQVKSRSLYGPLRAPTPGTSHSNGDGER